MKKLIAFLLVAVMMIGLAACGKINETEVSVLWADQADITLPGSLKDSMDKEMYLANINYTYYDADGKQETQTKQAEEVLNKGCSVLMVELVDPTAAQSIVDLAKAKNVPVVFFGCEVDEAIVKGYDKCYHVVADHESDVTVLGTKIAETLYDGKGNLVADKNADGKINYIAVGDSAPIVDAVNAKKAGVLVDITCDLSGLKVHTEEKTRTVFFFFKETYEVYTLTTADGTPVEMIITDTDTNALEVLKALQADPIGYNKGKAEKTVPVYTIGASVSAKDFTTEDDSLTAEENALFVYTASELVGDSKLAGTVIVDTDSIAAKAVAAAANFINGTANEKAVTKVPYIAG